MTVTQGIPGGCVLLIGLSPELNGELKAMLEGQHYPVYCEPDLSPAAGLRFARRTSVRLIFCPTRPSYYRAMLQLMELRGSALPLIVVSVKPEVRDWLDAMDAGAADYCSTPFDARHIAWIVQGALGSSPEAHHQRRRAS